MANGIRGNFPTCRNNGDFPNAAPETGPLRRIAHAWLSQTKSRLELVSGRPAVASGAILRTRGFNVVRLQADPSRPRAADRLRCASEPIAATLPNGSQLFGSAGRVML